MLYLLELLEHLSNKSSGQPLLTPCLFVFYFFTDSVVTHGNIRVESGDVKRAGSMIFFHGWYVWVTAQEWAATVLHFVGSRSRRPISSSRPCILVEIEGMWFDCLFTAFIYVQHHLCEPLDLLFCWSRGKYGGEGAAYLTVDAFSPYSNNHCKPCYCFCSW